MDMDRALTLFGLEKKEKAVYLMLLEYGWLTVLELSRKIDIKRPTLYRILEQMVQKGTVEMRSDDKKTYYCASNPDQLGSIILEKEQQLANLKSVYPGLIEELKRLQANKEKETNVIFYRGKRGLEYALIQEFNHKEKEIFILDVEKWYKTVDNKFAESIRERIVGNNLKIFELQNKDKTAIVPPSGKVDWTENKKYLFNHYYHRVISQKILEIRQDFVLFGDKIHFYGFKKHEIFVIEIQDHDLSQMLRQIFILLWNQAKKIDGFAGKDLSNEQ